MAEVLYQINGLLKLWDEDTYKNGAIPDSGGMSDVDLHFRGKTPDDVIEQCGEYLHVDKDGIERNAGDINGRVDFSLMEDSNSCFLTKNELKEWKKGKMKAYAVTYIAQVEMVISGIPV